MDPGQALRNDGLNPPRAPTLGGRLRESGIQAAETVIADEERDREPDDAGPARRRRLAGPHSENPEAPTGTGTTTGRSAAAANHRTALGSGAPAAEGGATSGGGGTPGGAGHRELRFPAARGSGSIGRLCHCCGGSGGSGGSGRGGGRRRHAGSAGGGRAGDRVPWARRREAWRWEQVLPWSARRGPLREGSTRLRTSGRGNRRRYGFRRLPTEHDHGCADPEQHAGIGSRGALVHPGATEGPAAGGLQDRHGVGERAQESAAATDPKPPGTASEAAGANPLRAEQRSHPRVLRQRTLPGQPPVPRRPGTSGNAAVLRRHSLGERTGSCIGM